MIQQAAVKLLAIVHERRQIQLEELISYLPEFTWNQVFSLVDGLSRQGLICIRRRGFEYELRVPSLST